MNFMRSRNENIKFLLTVSPVPLTATASGSHVEVATCYSKSVLRAVCGTLYARHDDVDYFPSYEIITSANNKGAYFEANKRTVSRSGVRTAMSMFMAAHDARPPKTTVLAGDDKPAETSEINTKITERMQSEDEVCEDILLEAFAKDQG